MLWKYDEPAFPSGGFRKSRTKEAIARVTAEIENYDAVMMTGPTSMMHFCGLPTVTVAEEEKDPNGVNEAVILYGKDEYRLYEAALAIEQMMQMKGIWVY